MFLNKLIALVSYEDVLLLDERLAMRMRNKMRLLSIYRQVVVAVSLFMPREEYNEDKDAKAAYAR